MDRDAAGGSDLVTVNEEKKRIYLFFRGALTRADAEELRSAYKRAIIRTGPGFTAVSVFEAFVPGESEIQNIIRSMIRMADEGGCRLAVRVAQGSVFGQLQLGRLQREIQAGYETYECETLADAEAFLDGR